GRATAILTVSNIAGTKIAVRTIVIATSLPVATVFAQDVIHPGSKALLASAPVIDGGSYAWAVQSMGALPTINGPQNAASLSYDVGSALGSYQLAVDISDASGHTATGSRTVTVARNVFLKDVRDPMPRSLHTATLLNDGRVLLAGGDGGVPDFNTLVPQVGSQSKVLGSAELFDPATRTFASVGAFTPRMAHTATLLDDGTVLAVGGTSNSTDALTVAELYDPASRTWTAAAQPAGARAFHTATVLADGRVLVVGGFDGSAALATAEIYNPANNSWTAAASMSVARALHSAVRLGDGKVLVAGGRNGSDTGNLASSELYDPAANTWVPAASLPDGRSAAGMVLLPGGKALILGGKSLIYDPQTDKWEDSVVVDPRAPSPTGVNATTAILLADGRVLAIGGYFHFNTSPVAIYDPIARTWTTLPPHEGSYGTATALLDGKVLETGGVSRGSEFVVASDFQSYGRAAVFDPAVPASIAIGSSAHSGADAQATVLADGRVLVSGGNVSRISTAQMATTAADIFNPSTNQWSATAPMSTARAAHRA